jgi:HSP20 family protein
MSKETTVSLSPNVCFDTDEDQSVFTLEIALPGVKKEDIDLKINEDSYAITAHRGDIKYVDAQAFCCKVVPKKASAKYDNGLLKITVPYKDTMDDAVTIKVL